MSLDLAYCDPTESIIDATIEVHTRATYMRLLKKPVGLLRNFNVPALKDGIYRRVL